MIFKFEDHCSTVGLVAGGLGILLYCLACAALPIAAIWAIYKLVVHFTA